SAGLLALAQALSVTERQLHGSPLNIRRVVSRICGALFRGSLARKTIGVQRKHSGIAENVAPLTKPSQA
ncbi:hypothetical protein QT920_021560, partial [Xanthomonas campestris pv. campestris]|uniref:hypothetical protein n=1 Tax=Xanthomonas campestris TaxID=339 RepID=UPI003556E654